MVKLAQGTKEYIVVPVTEVLGNITTLTGTGPLFDVFRDDADETLVLTGITAQNELMDALCLIDTTLPAFTEGAYNLYLYFSVPPETPRLGPVRFRVD